MSLLRSSNDLDYNLKSDHELPTLLPLSRFFPKVWDALHLHGLNDFSQSGCKIAMYSSVGRKDEEATAD